MSQQLQITSSSNPLFRVWKSLLTSKGIKENNRFFLMGSKLVSEFLKKPNSLYEPEYIIFDSEINVTTQIKKTILAKELFKELDVLGTQSPILILKFNDFNEKDFSTEPVGLELICPLGDPRNLGALTRTALGFGVNEIILTQEATHPYLPHSVKSSSGAVLKMNFLISSLKIESIPLVGSNYALALHGKKLNHIKWDSHLRLWVGEEGPGLKLNSEQSKKIQFINIPTENIESLNAMVSTSIALWDWKTKNE